MCRRRQRRLDIFMLFKYGIPWSAFVVGGNKCFLEIDTTFCEIDNNIKIETTNFSDKQRLNQWVKFCFRKLRAEQ